MNSAVLDLLSPSCRQGKMWCLAIVFGLCAVHRTVANSYQPEQIHLSYTGLLCVLDERLTCSLYATGVSNEMAVTWSTQLLANGSSVQYGPRNETLSSSVNASVSTFVDGSSAHRVLYMYRTVLKNLILNTSYSKSSLT